MGDGRVIHLAAELYNVAALKLLSRTRTALNAVDWSGSSTLHVAFHISEFLLYV